MTSASEEKRRNFNFFSVQGTGGSPTEPDPENRVRDQDIGSSDRPGSSGMQVPSEPVHCRAKTRPPWWPSRGVFFSPKCPSVTPAEISKTPRWYFGPLEDNQWWGCRLDPKKSRRELFQRILHSEFFGAGGVSRYASTPLIVTLSSGHSDITRFRPWSPIATGNNLDRAEKIPNLFRRLPQLTFLIRVQAFRDALRGELPHVQIFMNDVPYSVTWDARLLSYWFTRNPAVFQD